MKIWKKPDPIRYVKEAEGRITCRIDELESKCSEVSERLAELEAQLGERKPRQRKEAPQWRLWGAIRNNVHIDDGFGAWISEDASTGILAVADGVTTRCGAAASFYGVRHTVLAGKETLAGKERIQLTDLEEILKKVDQRLKALGPQELTPETSHWVSTVQGFISQEIGGKVLFPLTAFSREEGVYQSVFSSTSQCDLSKFTRGKIEYIQKWKEGEEKEPASTLLMAAFREDQIAVAFIGDGWLYWRISSEIGEGVIGHPRGMIQVRGDRQLASYIALKCGIKGTPYMMLLSAPVGTFLALATDGVPLRGKEVLLEEYSHQAKDSANSELACSFMEQLGVPGNRNDDATLMFLYRAR